MIVRDLKDYKERRGVGAESGTKNGGRSAFSTICLGDDALSRRKFQPARGFILHISEHLSLLWMCFKGDFR